jgi:Domain of unknown function (DUF4214)
MTAVALIAAWLLVPTLSALFTKPNRVAALPPEERFLMAAYKDLLGRPPDRQGLSHYTADLRAGASRTGVTHAIVTQDEYRLRTVQELYQRYLRRGGASGEVESRVNRLRAGDTWQEVKASFLGSEEYFLTRAGRANEGFLEALFADVLKRPVNPDERSRWAHQLASGASRQAVAIAILTSKEGY